MSQSQLIYFSQEGPSHWSERRSDRWMIILEIVAMCLWEAGPESLSLGLNILQKYKIARKY